MKGKLGTTLIHGVHDRREGRLTDNLAGSVLTIRDLARRRFLCSGGQALGGAVLASMAGLLSPLTACADAASERKVVKTGQFVFPRLQFSVYDETTDLWNVHPIGDVILRAKLAELTNMNISQDPKVVHLNDFDDMCRHPFVFMTSEGYFRLPQQEERNLREYLERGGFIFADDCVFNTVEDRFFRFYVELINKLFPGNPMRKIPYDHELFHCYYDFPKGAPHLQGVPHGAYGLFEPGTGRLMTIMTPGDEHCGWVSRFFPAEKNEAAIRFGINVIIYFLTH